VSAVELDHAVVVTARPPASGHDGGDVSAAAEGAAADGAAVGGGSSAGTIRP
jgi:hypothetical protein